MITSDRGKTYKALSDRGIFTETDVTINMHQSHKNDDKQRRAVQCAINNVKRNNIHRLMKAVRQEKARKMRDGLRRKRERVKKKKS